MSIVDDSLPPPVGDSAAGIVLQQHSPSATATQHDDATILDTTEIPPTRELSIANLEPEDAAIQVQEPAQLTSLWAIQSADTSVPSNHNEKLLTTDSAIYSAKDMNISSSITLNSESAVDNSVEMEKSIAGAPMNQVCC